MPPNEIYLLGALLIVVGTVIQDVVADAMSTEVVARIDARPASPSPTTRFAAELGMVQVLGRLSLSAGIACGRRSFGRAGRLCSRETVFLIGLVIPLISLIGMFMIREEKAASAADRLAHPRRRHRIRRGGSGVGARRHSLCQEIIFAVSMAVICAMLVFVTRELDHKSRMAILYTSIIIFAFRATPAVGDGYFWWTLDVLKFDEHFYGILRQTGAILALLGMWLFAKQLTEYSVTKTLLWLALIGTVLSIPNIGLYFGLHEWTKPIFGFGARSIAIIDTAAASPFAQLSMIPLLTLIAFMRPPGHRATWFALMASLMNLALVAGQLQTKYLNQIFLVQRGDYGELGGLLIVATSRLVRAADWGDPFARAQGMIRPGG